MRRSSRTHAHHDRAHGRFALQVTLPRLPRELEARIWRRVWCERDAAVRIQAAVRGAIADGWGLPRLIPVERWDDDVHVIDPVPYVLRYVLKDETCT